MTGRNGWPHDAARREMDAAVARWETAAKLRELDAALTRWGIETDEQGRVSTEDLRQAVKDGRIRPTVGTTAWLRNLLSDF